MDNDKIISTINMLKAQAQQMLLVADMLLEQVNVNPAPKSDKKVKREEEINEIMGKIK